MKSLLLVRPEQCSLCRKAATNGLCKECRNRTGIDGVICLFDYHDQRVKKLITTLKYGAQSDVARFIAENFRRPLIKRLPDMDATVTFVPLRKDRQASRGFNQAELLAINIIGDEAPILKLIEKVKLTVPQASLDKKERAKNVRGAFRVISKHVPENILIFDDVVTTGATLSAIAKVLKKAGAQTVWAVTIAHD